MKTKLENRKKLSVILKIAISLIVIIFFIFICLDYSLQSKQTIKTKTFHDIKEVSKNHDAIFESNINNQINLMVITSETLINKQYVSSDNKDNISTVLTTAVNHGLFSSLCASNLVGKTITNNAEIHFIETHYSFFVDAINGETTIRTSVDKETGKTFILIAMPLVKDNIIKGVLFGYFFADDIAEKILNYEYNGFGYGFVFDGNANILLTKQNINSNGNILEYFRTCTLEKSVTIADIESAIKNRKSLIFQFEIDEKILFANINPLVNMENYSVEWFSCSITDSSYVQQESVESQMFLAIAGVKLFLLVICIFLFIYIESKIKNNQIMKLNNENSTLLSNLQGGVLITKFDHIFNHYVITYVSEGWSSITGYSVNDIYLNFNGNIEEIIYENDKENYKNELISQIKKNKSYKLEYRIKRKDGEIVWVMDKGIVKQGNEENQSIITDITAIKLQEKELARSDRRFRFALTLSESLIYEFNYLTGQFTCCVNSQAVLGYDEDKVLEAMNQKGVDFLDRIKKFVYFEDIENIRKVNKTLYDEGEAECEIRLLKDGSYLWYKVNVIIIKDPITGKRVKAIAYVYNIDKLKTVNETLTIEVQNDPLTRIYNKKYSTDLIENYIKTRKGKHALLMLDIDDFKSVNDTLGHLYGDMVLLDSATKLKTIFSEEIVGRIGGDEFIVFLKNVNDIKTASKKAEMICNLFKDNYIGDKLNFKISCSVGVAFVDDCNFEETFKKADAALYQAKAEGKDCYKIFDESISQNVSRHHEEVGESDEDYSIKILEILYATDNLNDIKNAVFEYLYKIFAFESAYIIGVANDTVEVILKSEKGTIETFDNNYKNGKVLTSEYISNFKNNVFNCLDVDYDYVIDGYNMKNSIHIAIKDNEKLLGIVCFCGLDIKNKILISLISVCKIVGSFIIRRTNEEKQLAEEQSKNKALEALPTPIYIINKKKEIIYANKAFYDFSEGFSLKSKCYEVLFGLKTSCRNCGVKNENGKCLVKQYSKKLNKWFVSDMREISWKGEVATLVSLNDVTKFIESD